MSLTDEAFGQLMRLYGRARPEFVRSVGEANTVAPHVSISARRYGFCS